MLNFTVMSSWNNHVLISDEQMKDEMAGTTAIVVILKNNSNKIYCVRIILIKKWTKF